MNRPNVSGRNLRVRGLSKKGVSRGALLVLSLLSACAASDFGQDDQGRTSSFRPTGAFGAYLEGRFAAKRADLDVAADKLAVAARDSGIPEVLNQAFIAALLAGRGDAAAMAEKLPDNPVAQLVLADRAAQAGRWDEAETRFAGLSPQGITQVLRPLLVGWAQQGAGRTSAALATLQPYYDNGRLRGVMALHAAMIADIGGQTGDAARLYRLAQVEYGSLNLRLGVVLASWQARTGYGGEAQRILAEVAGNGELAMSRAALEADVSNRAVRTATDGIAETYLAMGATLHQQNANDTAQILLQLSLVMRPDLTAARLLLADVLETAKRPAAALEALKPVRSSDPLAAVVQLRRAMILDVLGQTAEGTALLEDLARTYPDRPEPLSQAGDMLRRKSRFAEAVTTYDRAVARLGTPSRANWPLFYERGVAYERSGDWARAESDFEYALKLAPDQPAILNYLGYAWVERNVNLDRARQMIQRAVDQQPNDGSFVDSLGWVLLRRGDAVGALKNLQHAVTLQSEDPVINGHLGDALAASGRWREAEFQWRRALTLKPDAEDEKRIVAKLATLPKPAVTRVAEPARPAR